MKSLIDSLTEQLGETAEVSVAAPRLALPDIINVSALLADEAMTPPPEIIEGIMAVGTKNVVAGSSKTNKTWSLLDLGIAVATGGTWLGLQALKGRVLYINLEILPPYLRKRLQALLGERSTEPLPNFDLLNLRGHPIELRALCVEVIKKLKAGGYILVIIDPIYKLLLGLDENRAGDIGAVCFELERIAKESGAAVVYAAHFSKGGQAGKESVDRISGSGVYGRDADTLITLTRHAVANCYTVEFTLRNHPYQAPVVVEWIFPRMVTRTDLDPAMLKNGRQKVAVEPEVLLRFVPEGSGAQILQADLLQLASEQGIGEQRAKGLLRRLVNDRELFIWKFPREGTRPAIGYGRTPQPMPGGGQVRKATKSGKGVAK